MITSAIAWLLDGSTIAVHFCCHNQCIPPLYAFSLFLLLRNHRPQLSTGVHCHVVDWHIVDWCLLCLRPSVLSTFRERCMSQGHFAIYNVLASTLAFVLNIQAGCIYSSAKLTLASAHVPPLVNGVQDLQSAVVEVKPVCLSFVNASRLLRLGIKRYLSSSSSSYQQQHCKASASWKSFE